MNPPGDVTEQEHAAAEAKQRQQTGSREEQKPDSPTDLTKPSWKYTARKTFREFLDDECTDLAAALTYYAVLALFPAMIAILSLVGLAGQGPETVQTLISILKQVGAGEIANVLEEPLGDLAKSQNVGFGLAIGLAGALWSASGYVNAFGRGMNRIYEIEEGRPFLKLRPMMLLVTLVTVVLTALVALGLALTGPPVEAVGRAIGLGDSAQLVFNIVKWPIMLAVVVFIVALLYYATPNVKQPKFTWVSVGAVVAILTWIVASLLFGFYVGNFGNYNKTYGSLAGVIVFLLWLWITNLALLFGAELDAELERTRELQAGIKAEETLQLPPRDTTKIEKAAEKEREDVERGRALRLSGGQESDPDDVSATSGSATTSAGGSDGRTARVTKGGASTDEPRRPSGEPLRRGGRFEETED